MAGRRLQKLIPRMKKVEISRAKFSLRQETFLMIFREWMYEQIFEGVASGVEVLLLVLAWLS